jgi:phage tail-like protein
VPLDYPPTSYYYAVRLATAAVADADASFREVSGLSVELAVEELGEGGENRFKHRLPTGAKYTNLVLKRGLLVASSLFFQWCRRTLQGNLYQPIVPSGILVVLLDKGGAPLKTWSVVNAWPVKWSVSDFNAMEGQVVIETLELAYQYFNVS